VGLSDRLKGLTKKAEATAAEHKDQIHQAVEKAEALADQRTAGQYHDKIAKAGEVANTYVDKLNAPVDPAGEQAAAQPEGPGGH
jgi:ABC-type transporter Mla subunit MlaD